MVSPNSPPDHAQNSPNTDQSDTSSIEDDPHSQNATLSRQTTNVNDCRRVKMKHLKKIIKDPSNFKRTCRNLSMDREDSNSTIKTPSPVHDQVDNSIPIEPELYMFLINGNKERVLNTGFNLCELRFKNDKNTVLHITANAGQEQLIRDIVPVCNGLIKCRNSKGDLAFHCAAKSAQTNALRALMDWDNYDSNAEISKDLLREKNELGDTALHIALENNQKDMAFRLLDQCPEACYMVNKKGVSPVYMAVELGYRDLVDKMIDYMKPEKAEMEVDLMQRKSVVYAAIRAKNINFLEKILKYHGKLIDSFNDEGQTPLSYAAFKGYVDGFRYLLKNFPHLAYKCNADKDGSFPIHQAASGGHVQIIKELHTTKQLLNKKGQNILHLAARDGNANVVSYLLKLPELKRFCNLKDEDGNTPLHLAAKGSHPRVVHILTRDSRIKHELQNKNGLTALDMAEIYPESVSAFEVRLTWMALRYVNAARSSQSTRQTYFQEYLNYHKGNHNSQENDNSKLENLNDRINALLVVATLVATVTFAAGFTVPGGYNQDGPNIGMAVLTDKWAFRVFIICNTAALFSSIMSVVSLIWANAGDLKVILLSLRFALPLLGFALTLMSLAFIMGLFVALRTLPWLSYVVLGMGFASLLVVLVLFIPLYNPSYIKNPAVRFFYTCFFLLLLLGYERAKLKMPKD